MKYVLEIYEFDPDRFLTAPGLLWQAALKKSKSKLYLLTDVDMLLMVEKSIRGTICHALHQYGRANNKYVKDYNENKTSSYLKYWDASNLYGQTMTQKLPVNDFKWVSDISEFDEIFIKSYNKESDD